MRAKEIIEAKDMRIIDLEKQIAQLEKNLTEMYYVHLSEIKSVKEWPKNLYSTVVFTSIDYIDTLDGDEKIKFFLNFVE